jgi:hypothetical protein
LRGKIVKDVSEKETKLLKRLPGIEPQIFREDLTNWANDEPDSPGDIPTAALSNGYEQDELPLTQSDLRETLPTRLLLAQAAV